MRGPYDFPRVGTPVPPCYNTNDPHTLLSKVLGDLGEQWADDLLSLLPPPSDAVMNKFFELWSAHKKLSEENELWAECIGVLLEKINFQNEGKTEQFSYKELDALADLKHALDEDDKVQSLLRDVLVPADPPTPEELLSLPDLSNRSLDSFFSEDSEGGTIASIVKSMHARRSRVEAKRNDEVFYSEQAFAEEVGIPGFQPSHTDLSKPWKHKGRPVKESSVVYEPGLLQRAEEGQSSPYALPPGPVQRYQAQDAPQMQTLPVVTPSDCTLVVRGVPPRYSQADLLEIWDPRLLKINFLFLPYSKKQHRSVTYCFVNFLSYEAAMEFQAAWSETILAVDKSDTKVMPLEICLSQVQGRAANMLHLHRDNKIKMLKFLPAVFDEVGNPVDFHNLLRSIRRSTKC